MKGSQRLSNKEIEKWNWNGKSCIVLDEKVEI